MNVQYIIMFLYCFSVPSFEFFDSSSCFTEIRTQFQSLLIICHCSIGHTFMLALLSQYQILHCKLPQEIVALLFFLAELFVFRLQDALDSNNALFIILSLL